jgi:broad specificity phosphatase PhoE
MTTLLMVRHGRTDFVGRALAGRLPGVHLDDEGRREAERVARTLEPPVHAVYSSPLERTRETAAPIARRFGCGLQVRPGLQEIDFGLWTGRTFTELASRADWQRFNERRSVAVIPGGEAIPDLMARVAAEIEALAARHPEERVVIVSHGDVIKAALFHYSGRSVDDMPHCDIPTGSVTVLAVEGRSKGCILPPLRG